MAFLSALIALTALHWPRLWRHSFPDLCSLTSYPSLLPNLLYNSSYEKEITTMPQSECLEISLTKRSFELYTNVLASSPIPNGFLFCKDFWATRIKIDVYHLRTSLACCFKLFHILPTNQSWNSKKPHSRFIATKPHFWNHFITFLITTTKLPVRSNLRTDGQFGLPRSEVIVHMIRHEQQKVWSVIRIQYTYGTVKKITS